MVFHPFDEKARETIGNLQKAFGKTIESRNISPQNISPKSIGIEIEIKFKCLFPELHAKYFSDINRYYSLPLEEKNKISQEISLAEKDILPLYQKTVTCGVPAGKDRYWEFAFDPVYNTTLLLDQIDILEQVGLIPTGHHSLHINIGDVRLNKRAYIITSALQLLYVTKERLINGIRDCQYPVAWARKGRAGIREKNGLHLINSESGYEIRTLEYTNLETLRKIFAFIAFFLGFDKEYRKLESQVDQLLRIYDLPNKNWENPVINPELWNKYLENFQKMADDFKKNPLVQSFV